MRDADFNLVKATSLLLVLLMVMAMIALCGCSPQVCYVRSVRVSPEYTVPALVPIAVSARQTETRTFKRAGLVADDGDIAEPATEPGGAMPAVVPGRSPAPGNATIVVGNLKSIPVTTAEDPGGILDKAKDWMSAALGWFAAGG